MIIKFQEQDRWVFFGEIDHLTHETINEDTSEKYVFGDKVLKYLPPNTPAKTEYNVLQFFTKNMTDATVICCYSPIYLMNDNGKTIEII